MSGRFETARKVKAPKPPREKKPRKKLQMPGWKTLLLLILNITLAALSVLCAARLTEYRNLLRTQEAADRWRGQSEERFAQVSAFLPVNETQDVSAVRTFRQKLDQAMIDASLEAPEGGSLYQDAWSGGKIERQDLWRRRRFLPVPSLHAPLRLVYCGVRLCAGPHRAG